MRAVDWLVRSEKPESRRDEPSVVLGGRPLNSKPCISGLPEPVALVLYLHPASVRRGTGDARAFSALMDFTPRVHVWPTMTYSPVAISGRVVGSSDTSLRRVGIGVGYWSYA